MIHVCVCQSAMFERVRACMYCVNVGGCACVHASMRACAQTTSITLHQF